MIAFPNFTVWDTIAIFEEHHVSDLLVDCWVVYQRQSFSAWGVWVGLGRLELRGSFSRLFYKFSLQTVFLFNDCDMPWVILDSNQFICFFFLLNGLRLQQREPSNDFICSKNILGQLLTRQCRFWTGVLHSSKEGGAQLWTSTHLALRYPSRRFYPYWP